MFSNSRQAEIERMEAEIRKLTKRRDDDSDDELSKKRAKSSYLEVELARYSKGRGLHRKDRKKDESGVLAALTSFRTKLKGSAPSEIEINVNSTEGEAGQETSMGGTEEGMEVDDDTGFMSHLLAFSKDNEDEAQKAERDYEVIDPRQRGARAKEEERERKRLQNVKRGGRVHRR